MKTTAEYINALSASKNALAENLREKGVSAFNTEKFNTLVPKVAEITGERDVFYGEWISLTNSELFVIENIPFRPQRIAISCEGVLQNQVSSTKDTIFIALLSVNGITSRPLMYQSSSNGITVSTSDIGADVTVTENGGLYSVTLSFDSANEHLTPPIYFKSGFIHTWVVSSDEWEV